MRRTDGDFADVRRIAIKKRLGIQKYGNQIAASGGTPSLLSYVNNTYDYLIAHNGNDLYKFAESTLANPVVISDVVIDLVSAANFAASGTIFIGDDEINYTGKVVNQLTGVTGISSAHATGSRVIQRIWKSIKTGLNATEWIGGVAMTSYSGAAADTGTVTPADAGTWTAVSFESNSGFTTLTDVTSAWQTDDLIGRKVEVNTGDFPDLEFTIIENGATYLRVEGNLVGGNTVTATKIAFDSTAVAVNLGDATITLTSGADFPAGGGTINIEDDIITYQSRAGAVLSGVSGISIGHHAGAIVTSGEVTLTSSSGFAENGAVKVNGDTIFFNSKIGNKLLNLSNIKQAYAIGATVTDNNYKTAVGKSYKISFISTATRLVDTTSAWTDDQFAGYIVLLTANTGAGQQRRITANKKDNLSVAFPWEEEPDATTTYSIYAGEDQIFYMGNGINNMMRFDGTTVTDLSTLPKSNILMVYKSRFFIADPAEPYVARYSDVGDPEYFPVQNTITPPGDDKITGFGEWNGNGIIFKERSIWRFNFQFNDTSGIFDVVLDQIPANSGCVSHRTIQKVENVLWYYDGFAIRYLGASPNQIGVIRTEEISFLLKNKLIQVPKDFYGDAIAAYDDFNYLMFCRENSDSVNNDIGYGYDTNYLSWATRKGNSAMSFVVHQGVRYYGDSTAGQIFVMDVENYYNDDTSAIDMIVETKDDDLGDAALFKTFRWAEFGFENDDSSVEYVSRIYTTRYTLTREGNWDIGFGLNINPTIAQGATLGQGILGTYSDAPRRIIRKVSIGLQGTRIQHQLRNRQLNEKLTITDIANVWYARPSRHFPSVLIS